MMIESEVEQPSKFLVWVKASRLPSLLYILLPLSLGQFLSFYYGRSWSESIFFLSLFYGFFLQLFIVFANDLADFETDRINQTATIFSGGSRVLPEKLLSFRELTFASLFCLGLTVFFVLCLAYEAQSFFVLPLALAGPFLLWMYSYKPFKLSYRGGGEILQALGLSCVLPFLGFLLQGGGAFLACFYLCLILFPTNLACAMSTAIPDATSDARSYKMTFVVSLGPYKSCLFILLLHTVSYFLAFFFLEKELLFSGIANSVYSIILPQFLLTSLLVYSFYKRHISFFVFFSISYVFYLLGYFICLSF